MINRFTVALESLDDPAPQLDNLTEDLHTAVLEAEAYECNPLTDPAVLLLAMQVGFLTHADVANSTSYNALIAACKVNAPLGVIDPLRIN